MYPEVSEFAQFGGSVVIHTAVSTASVSPTLSWYLLSDIQEATEAAH